MTANTAKTLLILAAFGAWASMAPAVIVTSLGTTTNNFNSPAQFQANMLQEVAYAIGVGNIANVTVGGVSFLGDSVISPPLTTNFDLVVTGYSVSNGKSWLGNTPGMSDPNLNALLKDNRFGNNNGACSYTLPVTPGQPYNLQLLIWENYATTGPIRPEGMQINTGSGLQQAFTIGDTINDLAGPVSTNGFLWSYSFKPTISSVTLSFGGGGQILNGIILTVPEPATVSLLALGGLALLRRRK